MIKSFREEREVGRELTPKWSPRLPESSPLFLTEYAVYAHNVLSSVVEGSPIDEAFKAFKLDREELADWRRLAELLAGLLFPPPKSIGRPSDWTPDRYCELLEEVEKMKSKRKNNKVSDLAACKEIVLNPKSARFFRQAGVEGLRKALTRARDFPSQPLADLVRTKGIKAFPPNAHWLLLAETSETGIGLDEYSAVAAKIAADSDLAVKKLLARWRELKKLRP